MHRSFDTINKDGLPVAIILGISADIGISIAQRLIDDGWFVVGLGRNTDRLEEIINHNAFKFIVCDLGSSDSIRISLNTFRSFNLSWELFASCVGTMEPIGPFFNTKFEEWAESISINFVSQLHVLHKYWTCRSPGIDINIMFLAGGGTNNPFTNYSAYCVSKIALIKMCELIDDEEAAANIFIIGPGFVKTRIHNETFQAGLLSGSGYGKTLEFMKTNGTSYQDIYDNLKWCINAGRSVVGGRNISTVHDPWRVGGIELKEKLSSDPDAYKLRRKPFKP
jgi:NAD(P)-dependent dehydrogenase (short-subunit alcohol dehydrogenase family)